MNSIEEIKAHKKEILSGTLPADLQMCPKCKEYHHDFILHERRRRLFLVIVEDLVHRVWSLLARWKCGLCGSTFTGYPSFAIPYKRYTVQNILEFSQHYVETPSMTYQKVVQHEKTAIGHSGDEAAQVGRQFTGSTVWRWLGLLGTLSRTVRTALHLIRQSSPASGIFRTLHPVHPRKYRSTERKNILQQSLRFFDTESEYRSLFGVSFFPQLAIGGFMN